MLQVGPVKAFLDGTLGSRTARMLEAFADAGDGLELMCRADFAALVREAAEGGLAVAVHAIGDRANREALDAFEQTRERGSRSGFGSGSSTCSCSTPTTWRGSARSA